MAVIARASRAELERAWAQLAEPPELTSLRPAEPGLVMVQGRIGGGGAPFNLGEATVTRATLRLASGEVGVGWVLGRDRARARLAAAFDALWQAPHHRQTVEVTLLAPVRARLDAERERQRRQTAATRVDFFTLVRGEDS
jgi:alpha-D-ribose 1-methylphosphonate 5-triphosphate synthase subunit PhnG